ncbi:hypothetical protein [Mameliella alba]|uniref:hypothetical protein n=1 Tax=Mameliella alba TaxID=561184 RepID=UPI0014306585|nr:hypothetical protein [Mameliella alba]
MRAPPFNTYYPTVGDMDRGQKRFYKHLRGAVEKGEFVDVGEHISYVFCYAYEAIDPKNPRKSLGALTKLAKLYDGNPKLPDYLNGWAADCAILLGDLRQALELLPEPKLGTTWGLTANTRLSLKHALKLPPEPRELVAVVGPKVTKYGRENLEGVEQYLGVQLGELQLRSNNLISDWISEYQIHSTAFHPFNGVPSDHQRHTGFTEYHFSNCDLFRNHVAGQIRQAENALRTDKGLPRIGEGWISETHLYYQLVEVFTDHQVLQHARPPWLGRQHLDVFIPELFVAVEFQGEQHDRPIDFFGGQKAFEENQRRDKRKRAACKRNGVDLFEVRKGYDIDQLVREIKEKSSAHGSRHPSKRSAGH